MAYDGFGRLSATTTTMDGVSRTLSNAFDVTGNRTWLYWMDGWATKFTYDPSSRLRAILKSTGAVNTAITAFNYERLGRKASQQVSFGFVTQWGYDAVSRLSSLTLNPVGTAGDAVWSYGYNPASQIASTTRDNDAYAWTGHYDVDRAYSTNGLNQLTSRGPSTGSGQTVALTYDGRGNVISVGSAAFGYSRENQPTETAAQVIRYDPAGRLLLLEPQVRTL